jgi:hypothetical protein
MKASIIVTFAAVGSVSAGGINGGSITWPPKGSEIVFDCVDAIYADGMFSLVQ